MMHESPPIAGDLCRRLIRGVGATSFGQVVNAVIQLASLPVFLAVWGVAQYGEWLVLSSLAAFLSMSDVGFATAAANEMTMRVGRGDKQGAVVVYHSMWALLCTLGLVMLAIVLVLLWGTPLVGWLPLTAAPQVEAAFVLSVLTIYILVGLQIGVIKAGFRCDGNFALGTMLGTGQRFAEFLAQILTAALTGSMLAVAAAGLVVRIGALVVFKLVLARKSPWLMLGFKRARLATIRQLVAPALSFMGMPLGHALGNQGMIQVVAAVLGPAAVVVFTAHRTIANVALQLISVINQAVWPELSTAFGAGDHDLMRRLHRTACQWSIWLCAFGCITLAFVAPVLMDVWTGGRIVIQYGLLMSFLAVILLRSTWRASCVVPIATNRHQIVTVIYVLGTATSCVSAVAIAPLWGLVGVALSVIIADLLLTMVVVRTSLFIVQDSLWNFGCNLLKPPFLSQLARWYVEDAESPASSTWRRLPIDENA